MKDIANAKSTTTVLLAILIATIGANFGNLMQSASGSGGYGSAVESENEVKIAQLILQLNRCDESDRGDNFANCFNDAVNEVGDINQENAAAFFIGNAELENEVEIKQKIYQKNDCNESGSGDNNARCFNDAVNEVGNINQENFGSGGYGSVEYENEVEINQEIKQKNDCDESGGGDNNAFCSNDADNTVGDITQSNSGYGGSEESENEVDIKQSIKQENDCDESGGGDNDADCSNTASNSIGNIDQSNDGDSNMEQSISQSNSAEEEEEEDNNRASSNSEEEEEGEDNNRASSSNEEEEGDESENDVEIEQNISQSNDNDEEGDGDNNSSGSNTASNSVGNINQSNDD